MRRIMLSASLVLFVAVAVSGTACSSDSGGIGTTLDEWTITLGETSGASGEITFDISNEGAKVHEFVVFQTDLAEDQLPTTTEEGEIIVDEAGEGLTAVDEVEDIAPGSDASLTVNLQPGTYVVLCNRPGHWENGMHATFTVA
jgi:uncharacterized cupredoxin-like copper-binding protein